MKKIVIVGILLVITFLAVISDVTLAQDLQYTNGQINNESEEIVSKESTRKFDTFMKQNLM